MDELARMTRSARGDRRTVVKDDGVSMLAAVRGDALTAGFESDIATTTYEQWLTAR
jgi:hypothetical protein